MMFPPETHAKVSPSRLQRILDCPGSFALTQKYESTQSVYAAEGTHLHLAVEQHLRKYHINSEDLGWAQISINADIVSPRLDDEQLAACQDCVDYLYGIWRTLENPTLAIEERVYLKGFNPCLYESDGTCDIILRTANSIHVIDWKFGKGVPVYADGNDQLLAYLAGACENNERMFTYASLNIHVVQPRLDNYDTDELTPEDLAFWLGSRVIPGVMKAYERHAPFNPGKKQCMWCPAKTDCRARYNFANQTAADVFAAADGLPDVVSKEELTEIYKRGLELSQYVKDIGLHIQRTIQNGTTWPGYKMVAGRSNRKWNALECDIIEFLDDADIDIADMFVSKFISPAQAEKLNRKLKKDEDFQALIDKPEGKPTLVSEYDKRPAIQYRTASEIFKETE